MNKLLVTVLVSTLFLAACGDGADRQEKYLERAQRYFAEENFDKARIDAQNVLQINPKNVEARQILGDISFQNGDIRKAYGMYLSILEESPDHVGANTALAKTYIAVRSYEQALEHVNTVLAVEPENAKVLGYKALTLAGLEMIPEAEEIAEQALALDPGVTEAIGVTVQKYYNAKQPELALPILDRGIEANPDEPRISTMKITLLESMGKTDEVEAELLRLVERFPEEQDYVTTLSRFYIQQSRIDDAEKALEDFIKVDPENADAKLALIAFKLRHRSKEEAIALVEGYMEAEPSRSEYYTALAQLHLFTGDRDQAVGILEDAIDSDPRSVGAIEARNLLVGIYLQDGEVDTAKKILEEVLDIEPENAPALLARARLSLASVQIREGIADLRVILKNDPESTEALKLLAQAQEYNGSTDLALDNYKKLMTIEKPDLDVLAGAARLSIQAEQYQEAENYIRQALEEDADNAGLVTNLIRLLVIKEDWDSATAFANRLIESEDSAALGHYLQSGLELRQEKFDSAIGSLEKSLAAEPKAIESLTALAQLKFEKESPEKAIAFVGEHCEANSDMSACYHILGTLHARTGDFDAAETSLQQAIALNDQQLVSYRQLGKVYGAKQELDKVEATVRQGIEATGNEGLKFDLANFFYQIERYEDAADVYIDMIEQNQDALSAKNNLAMLYAEFLNSEENMQRAQSLISDLQDSENPAYLDTVGWVLYLSGEYGRAVTYLQAAVDKVGSSPLLQYHLGMALYKNGDLERAKEHLTLAVADEETRYAGFDEAKETLAKIQ